VAFNAPNLGIGYQAGHIEFEVYNDNLNKVFIFIFIYIN
jgi:hypothetical protein